MNGPHVSTAEWVVELINGGHGELDGCAWGSRQRGGDQEMGEDRDDACRRGYCGHLVIVAAVAVIDGVAVDDQRFVLPGQRIGVHFAQAGDGVSPLEAGNRWNGCGGG